MYYRYFGLTEAPFSIAVNPRYLFMSARHRDALAHLLYGVGEGGGFILLTGEVGTGKTTIIRSLLEQLPADTDIAMVFNPALNASELLATVCDELDVSYMQDAESLKTLTDSLHQFLLRNHARGRHTVLLIDEAQHLQYEVLEQIRLLTNLETNTKKLLQIILVGQPELRSLLNKPELRQLAQRITARYQLKPLDLQETDDYIRHRLQVAGLPAGQVLFPRPTVKAIHRLSRGVPRIINVLCDRMLLGAYGQNKAAVDRPIMRQAVKEVLETEEARSLQLDRFKTPALVALSVACIALVTLLLWPSATTPPSAVEPVAAIAPAVMPPPQPTPPAPPAPTPAAPPALAELWYRSEPEAIATLQALLPSSDAATGACHENAGHRLRCQRISVNSWQELREYNRPSVLTLLTPAKLRRYVVVLGFDDDHVFLQHGDDRYSQPLADLGQQWTGDALFFWQTHPDYAGPFGKDDRGPLVSWLAQQFATLDQQPRSLSDERFNSALQQRVKLFQEENGLEADGVVGLMTLLKLNERLASPRTFISALPSPMADPLTQASRDG